MSVKSLDGKQIHKSLIEKLSENQAKKNKIESFYIFTNKFAGIELPTNKRQNSKKKQIIHQIGFEINQCCVWLSTRINLMYHDCLQHAHTNSLSNP